MQPPTLVILHGLPGSGKGTLSAKLRELPNASILHCGDLIRSEISKATIQGRKFRTFLRAGFLIPDGDIAHFIHRNIKNIGPHSGTIVFDGYPRTPEQADALCNFFNTRNDSLPIVISLQLSLKIASQRVQDRRVCQKCGALYNVISMPARVSDRCDFDGAPLVSRPDQQGALLRKRMKNYSDAHRRLTTYFRQKHFPTFTVDAKLSPYVVASKAISFILKFIPHFNHEPPESLSAVATP